MGAPFARRCSAPLRVAHLCAARPVRMDVYGGRGFVDAFLGVKGSPVQIRPSRRRSKGWFRVSAATFWLQWERTCAPIRCADQAEWRALPCRHPDQRLLALSASACWFPPFPADSGELSSRSRGRRSDPAVKGWFWATTAAEGRRRPAATTLSRLGPRRPATWTARAFRCSFATADGQYADLPTGGHQPQLRLSPTVTICTGWHPYARRQIADCSDLTIVPTWAWIRLPGRASAVSRSGQSGSLG